MKKILTAFLVLVMALSCFAFIGCKDQGDMKETLDMYIFDKDGQTVSEDFVLPGSIGGYKTRWTSDNEVISLEELAEDEEGGIERQYVAKVGLPEERTEINLTVSLSASIKKTFTVYVNALSVYDFSGAYNFIQNNGMVVADFDLDTTCEFKGHTATIAWSVEEEYADYIEISEDGTKCIVYPTPLNPRVRINATFTYNGESTTKAYRMTVSEQKEPLQEVDFWYTNTGVGIVMSGYVVSIATVYSESFGNVSLYMVNDEFTAGYYLYRVKADSSNAALLAPGVHITVTGTTNTNYNGLIETNAGGNLVVDGDIPAINVNEKVYAIDNDVLGNLQSAYYHQSRLVSLTNWEVKEIKAPVQAGATGTLFTLTKGGVDVSIAVSKYMEGAYLCKAEDATWSALANLQNTVKVGDIVSVTGVLGNYKGHQIMPLSAEAVVVGGTADAEGTVYAGQKVAKAVAAIDKLIADNGLDSIVAVAKNVALPESVEGCEVAYRIIGTPRTISIVEGALVINPGKVERACLTATVTVDGFTTNIFRYIDAADLSDADKIDMEIEAFDFEIKSEIASDTKVELPASGSIFDGVAITWTLNGEAISGSANFVCGAVEAAYTLVATFELNGVTKSVTYEGKVLAGAGSKSVELTVDSLAIADSSYVQGTAKVGAVEFEYVELGNYGNGIQMRNKTVASTLWNTTAIDISKIELIYNASQAKYSNADALKFEFSNNADFSGAYVTFLSTEKGKVDAYTVQADATYKYVRITNNITYSLYWDSITVYYKASGDAPVECEHEWSEATCQAPKTCSKCGATEGEVADHTFVDGKCSVCGTEDPGHVPPVANTWTLVTELKDGDQVLIGAPAYGKLLSAEKVSASSYYNKGVDYSATNFDNVTDAEIFVVTVNADGTYTFTSLTGKVIALADSYSSLNDTGIHKTWTLEAKGESTFLVKNVGRNTYLEWYSSKDNWSTYTAGNTNEYELSFYAKKSAPVECEHEWLDATCQAPKTCSKCGATEGEVADHNYVEGKCSVCGAEDPNYVPPVANTWTLVTELKDGDQVLIGAPAYGKLLSAEKVSASSFYNKGVDYSATNFDNVTDAEIFVVTVNADGTYTFTSLTGKVIALAESYSSLNDTGIHKTWTLEAKGESTFLVKNVGRNTYLEWYSSKDNWSTYTAGNTNEYELSFYAKKSAPVECEHEWSEATCQAPKTCSKCGATEGEVADHTFVEGKCSVCGAEDPNYVAPEVPVVSGGRADLETMDPGTTNGGYGQYDKDFTSATGWTTDNSAIQVGGSSDANPVFIFFGVGNKAVCINGKVGASGVLRSPVLSGGIDKLTFNYGHAFSDKNGVNINITITEVATGKETVLNLVVEAANIVQKTAYVAEFVLEAPIAGDFTIVFTNNSPSNSSSGNKDRVSLWNIEWTAPEAGGEVNPPVECAHEWTGMGSNEKGHWLVCALCQATGEVSEHTERVINNGETHARECGHCGYVIAAEEAHVYTDGTCACGAAEPVVTPGLSEGVGYTISAVNGKGTLYFNGTISSGRFNGTYTAADATIVYVEKAANAGEFYLYFMNAGVKTYICMNDSSSGGKFVTDVASATIYEWNADKQTLAVADDANNRAFGVGATSTYDNFSAYDLSGNYNWGAFTPVE